MHAVHLDLRARRQSAARAGLQRRHARVARAAMPGPYGVYSKLPL